ncbi:MAG: bifunctional 4-hydroxy-2-oxoglutarate aldolase/2-dehydro-3-deoxy-phosphogluconate aldolase [Chitinophagaceae bacterium]|nr:MAG: bifunctional 4-hydroxy-2-oxoglutarate aldolase/2-dehydro-3-deoxy-phosphogluconate aldolase [Chitinophagaceae bacterium]
MDNQENFIAQVKEQGILPLFYHNDPVVCVEVVKALYKAGVRVIEFTNRGEAALDNFRVLAALKSELEGLVIAVGTIRTAEQARRFIDAGADFLISPVFDADVADIAYINKVLWIPGCMTPTEVHEAGKAGCRLVKVFPGNVVGPAFVSGVRELFPEIEFMPTGGVEIEKENMFAWFNAGVCAVGLGSKLVTKAILENREYFRITDLTEKALDLVKQYRE